MEKLPRKRPAGHTDPMAMVAEHLPGLVIDRINLFIHDLLDQMDGATGGVFNLDDLADRLYGTERGLQTNVPRLDNRINAIIIGNMQAQLAEFYSTDTWYKPADAKYIKIDVIGAPSGGGRAGSAYARGEGGYSGGWASYEFDAIDVPSAVLCTVGAGGAGATTDGGKGADGGLSSFGDLIAATGGSSINGTYGSAVNPLHNQIFRIRGGHGQRLGLNASAPTAGGEGTFGLPGGDAPPSNGGDIGGSGLNVEAGKIGMGSGGAGGAAKTGAGSGGRGGHGGTPGGPGGGGGAYETFGFAGNGGNGGGGAVFVTTRFY